MWRRIKMESVTDVNYKDFSRNSSRAALLVSTSWCQQCKKYLPTIETLSRQMPFIRFGETVLDKDRSSQLKREYPDIRKWVLPSTVFFREQERIGKIHGLATYRELVSKVQEYLLLDTIVFVQNSDGIYIPASIKQINGVKQPYLVKLEEDSSLGEKGTTVQIPVEKIKWGLEAKV
jgi:thiol-disulfide isomerase/thioredoxin